MKMNIIKFLSVIMFISVALCRGTAQADSLRAERRLINEGNKLYTERKFSEAAKKYEEALGVNASSTVGRYNLGLAQIKQVTNPQDTTPKSKSLLDNARTNLNAVASQAKEKPGLASKANYNLGNLEFNVKDYKKAIEYYKQALRIDPKDDSARKNLRIAQKQLQNQDKQDDQKNQDQNQQNQDQQDQNKDQNQDQNKDQQQQQNQNQDKQEQQKDNNISQQTANQILQAVDNKENQTRARVNRANKGEKAVGQGSARKKW